MYVDATGPELIRQAGLRALLTDRIEVGAVELDPRAGRPSSGACAATTRLPWLPALTGMIVGSRAESDAFLYDFRRTLADLVASEHYGTVAKVAHEHGLKVYGEALENGRPSLGDDMAMRAHNDIPMAAMWTYRPEKGPNVASYLADMKGAASVAHIYGQELGGRRVDDLGHVALGACARPTCGASSTSSSPTASTGPSSTPRSTSRSTTSSPGCR